MQQRKIFVTSCYKRNNGEITAHFKICWAFIISSGPNYSKIVRPNRQAHVFYFVSQIKDIYPVDMICLYNTRLLRTEVRERRTGRELVGYTLFERVTVQPNPPATL